MKAKKTGGCQKMFCSPRHTAQKRGVWDEVASKVE
jgi:hypothetical protein